MSGMMLQPTFLYGVQREVNGGVHFIGESTLVYTTVHIKRGLYGVQREVNVVNGGVHSIGESILVYTKVHIKWPLRRTEGGQRVRPFYRLEYTSIH